MASRGAGSQRNWTVSYKDKTCGLAQWSPLNARHLKVLGLHRPSGSPCLTSYTTSPDRDHLASSEGRVFLQASYPLLPGSALHVPLGPLLIRTRLTVTSLKGPTWWRQCYWRHRGLLKVGSVAGPLISLHPLSLFYTGVGVCLVRRGSGENSICSHVLPRPQSQSPDPLCLPRSQRVSANEEHSLLLNDWETCLHLPSHSQILIVPTTVRSVRGVAGRDFRASL